MTVEAGDKSFDLETINLSPFGAKVRLELWKPGTRRVDDGSTKRSRAAASAAPAAQQRLSFTAPERGWYYIEVKVASPGYGPYTLTLAKTRQRR